MHHSSTTIAQITVGSLIRRGLRGVPLLVSDVSAVYATTGLHFRSRPIRDVVPLGPLRVFWLGMTGEDPTEAEALRLQEELADLASIPDYVAESVGTMSLAPRVHPLDLFGAGILAMASSESQYRSARAQGESRDKLILAAVADAKRLFALVPKLAAAIFRRLYGYEELPSANAANWGACLAASMGVPHEAAPDFFNRYGVIHADQGKGNFSCHSAHLVGSTGADPFLCAVAAVNALAGPAHARASQEVMELICDVQLALGECPSIPSLVAYLIARSSDGRALPGHGQAVMKNADTRFLELYDFALAYEARSVNLRIASLIWISYPEVLAGLGRRISSRHPNVNLISAPLLHWLGVTQQEFYPVLFATSRMLGVLCQFVENVIWGTSPERPDSLTTSDFNPLLGIASIGP